MLERFDLCKIKVTFRNSVLECNVFGFMPSLGNIPDLCWQQGKDAFSEFSKKSCQGNLIMPPA